MLTLRGTLSVRSRTLGWHRSPAGLVGDSTLVVHDDNATLDFSFAMGGGGGLRVQATLWALWAPCLFKFNWAGGWVGVGLLRQRTPASTRCQCVGRWGPAYFGRPICCEARCSPLEMIANCARAPLCSCLRSQRVPWDRAKPNSARLPPRLPRWPGCAASLCIIARTHSRLRCTGECGERGGRGEGDALPL